MGGDGREALHLHDGQGNRVLDQCLDCGRNQPCGDAAAERRQWVRQQSPATWQPMTSYFVGTVIAIGNGLYTCARSGTSGGRSPIGVGSSITDGTVAWSEVGTATRNGRGRPIDQVQVTVNVSLPSAADPRAQAARPGSRKPAPAKRPVPKPERRDLDLDVEQRQEPAAAPAAVTRRDLDLD